MLISWYNTRKKKECSKIPFKADLEPFSSLSNGEDFLGVLLVGTEGKASREGWFLKMNKKKLVKPIKLWPILEKKG